MTTHINHTRRLHQQRIMNITEAIPQDQTDISFGAFAGEEFQRYAVGHHEIARAFGRRGIVLVHNDPNFEASIGNVYTLAVSGNRNQIYLANPNGSYNSCYDPLYGLRAGDVLDAIVPVPANSYVINDIQSLRSALNDYLHIMQWQFEKNSAPFGAYPYNLDLLIQLVSMPFPELERNVLAFLPSSLASMISTRLSAQDIQQRVYNAVHSFAQKLSLSLWKRRDASSHSRLSIISSVMNRDMISIYVPSSRSEILDYLSVELKALNDQNVPYLLVTSGISIHNSDSFSRLFLDDHLHVNYTTGILAEDLSTVIGDDSPSSKLASVFTQIQEMFVFECASTISASPFSEGIGQYYRRLQETSTSTQHAPFHFFASHGYATNQHEVQQAVINPEELINLGAGCLLYGKNYSVPVLVSYFTL